MIGVGRVSDFGIVSMVVVFIFSFFALSRLFSVQVEIIFLCLQTHSRVIQEPYFCPYSLQLVRIFLGLYWRSNALTEGE
jgi:hypothetical protein